MPHPTERIWLWKHPATERFYISTVAPGPRARRGLKADGYKLYAVDIALPDEAYVPEYDGLLRAQGERDDDFPVHAGDRLVFPTGGEGGVERRGTCAALDATYVRVTWDHTSAEGSFTRAHIRKLVEMGLLQVNP